MFADLKSVLKLEVPFIVQLGQRHMAVGDFMSLAPGAIIELPKGAEDELEVLVNNKVIGAGTAVKVGENFGVKVTFIGDLKERIQALGGTGIAKYATEPVIAKPDDQEPPIEAAA